MHQSTPRTHDGSLEILEGPTHAHRPTDQSNLAAASKRPGWPDLTAAMQKVPLGVTVGSCGTKTNPRA